MAKGKRKYDRIDGSEEIVIRKNGIHAGDVILVILAVLLMAVLILAASIVVPAVRARFSEFDEELLFTVEFPLTAENAQKLPEIGDVWMLLDSDGAVCTVREVNYSEEDSICRVALLRGSATYRKGEGYVIESTRIAVGATLYFKRNPEHYFAVTVTGLSSERFLGIELAEETEQASDEEGEENHG